MPTILCNGIGGEFFIREFWCFPSKMGDFSVQAHNQTLLEEGSKPGMVTQINSKLGSILVRNTFSMCVAF